MTNEIDWPPIIEETLIKGVISMCEDNRDLALFAFLTGSYSRGRHNPVRPNVNIYIIARANQSPELRVAAGSAWSRLRQVLREQGVAFRVDCHPYTVAWRSEQDRGKPLLELTTKVLDARHAHERFSLPPTIGLGWLASYRPLWGDGTVMKQLELSTSPSPRPAEWLTSLHEGLSHYRSVLDHLPNAIPVDERPEIFAEEACFYGLEAFKDAASLAYDFSELARGENVMVLNRQDETALFSSLGWADLSECARVLKESEARIAGGGPMDKAAAIEIWMQALDVWGRVWTRYTERVVATLGDECPWLQRVNAFV